MNKSNKPYTFLIKDCQSRITTEEGGMSMGYVIDEGDESNLKASKNTREYSLLQWDLISK